MKVLVFGGTGGTGRLIVRFRPGERPFRRGPGSLEGRAPISRGVDRVAGDARDEGDPHLFSCGEGRRKTSFNATTRRQSRQCSALISVAYKSRLIAERFKPFKPQEEERS
jgi:hypothetical protein